MLKRLGRVWWWGKRVVAHKKLFLFVSTIAGGRVVRVLRTLLILRWIFFAVVVVLALLAVTVSVALVVWLSHKL